MIWSSIASMTSSCVLLRVTGRHVASDPAGRCTCGRTSSSSALSTIALF
ncbi:hypothetical protein [Brachybacterium sacelli]